MKGNIKGKKFSMLRAAIVEKNMNHSDFAKKMGMYPQALSERLNGKREWKLSECIKASMILDKPIDKIFPATEFENEQDGGLNYVQDGS